MAEETNGIPQKKIRSRRKAGGGKYRFRRIVFLLLVIILIWWFNNYTLKTTRLTLRSDKLKGDVRIAVISDLHANSMSIGNKRIIKRIEKEDPDLVFILGDMFSEGSNADKQEISVSLTQELVDDGYPVYYVNGEHDNVKSYFKRLREVGAKVMNYKSEIVEINGNRLFIMGIDNVHYSDTFDLNNEFSLRDDCYNILLAHIPNYEKFADFGADLTLCADTHGGMVQIPFGVGMAYSTDYQKWFPEKTLDNTEIYDKGLFKYEGGAMFITSGLGDSPAPIRFNNRPEVVIIDLKS